MKDKKSFVLYSDYKELFEELSSSDAGELIKHIFSYVNDENPQTENPIVRVSFIPIKRQLKRDLEKYEDKKKQWSDAGKASAAKRKESIRDERSLTSVDSVATVSTVNVNGNVTVNDNVNEIKENKTKTDLLNSQKWIESVAKNYKFTADQITAHLVSFIHEQSLKGELDRPLKDLKNHFVNVIKKLPPPTFESPFANYAV